MNPPTVTDLRAVTTVSITRAGAFLGLSQATAYRAASQGSLPVITVGRTRRVPTPLLLALVGLSYETPDRPHNDHDPAAPHPTLISENGRDLDEQAPEGSPNQRLNLRGPTA